MKDIVRFLSLILIGCAVYFGYNGAQNINSGDDSVFIVDKQITINVTDEGEYVKYSFVNTSDKLYNVKINFGIKGDSNYTEGSDEIVFVIKNFVASEEAIDIDIYKDNFKKGESFKNDKLGHATILIGESVELIGEYTYVHKIDVGADGKLEEFNNGGSIDYVSFGAAAICIVIAIFLFAKANKMPDPVKPEKKTKKGKKKEEASLWDNEPTDNFEEVSYSSSDTVRLSEEEKAKYLEGMQVIDMKKDELE